MPHDKPMGATGAQPQPVVLVDALNGVFGKHAGMRASHAKGVSVSGYFRPDVRALAVTHGPLWQTAQSPVVGRFSIGGGNPKASDKGKTVRGLSLNVGDQWHMVGFSAPVFMVATPEEFIGFLNARQPDPSTGKPNPDKVKAFNAYTPSTKAQLDYLDQAPVPSSYGRVQYWGVNAFKYINAAGVVQHGRWLLEPQDGVSGLSEQDLAHLSDDFLVPELEQRLATGPLRFNLVLQLAVLGDDVTNPTKQWSEHNPQVALGEVVITTFNPDAEAHVYDPTQLPMQGMALSDDPILLARSAAYAVSKARRTGVH